MRRKRPGIAARTLAALEPKQLATLLVALAGLAGYFQNTGKIEQASARGYRATGRLDSLRAAHERLALEVAELQSLRDRLIRAERLLRRQVPTTAAVMDTTEVAAKRPGPIRRFWSWIWSPFHRGSA